MDPGVSRTVALRETLGLDGEWEWIPDPEGHLTAAALPAGRPIGVPGCWEAQIPASQGILTAWYRRTLSVPAAWRGQRVLIRFGAAMYHAGVHLNGRLIDEHEGGYTPFAVDVTEDVRWGVSNDLAVRVRNPMNSIATFPASDAEFAAADALSPDLPASEIPHGKQSWYASQSGIWQSVVLERQPFVALEPLRIVPDVAGSAATVRWGVRGLAPESAGTGGVRSEAVIELTVIDPDGHPLGGVTTAQLDASRATGETRVPVAAPRLWDIGRPNLYRIDARLLLDGEPVDSASARFGMREIRTEGGRIVLNGRPIYIVGVLDQDLYAETISTPPSRTMLDEQIARARELGINLLRCHIKVPDPAYLDAADEAGMLVWCELPNWRTFSSAAAGRGRETLRAMIEDLGNHPSVVIWTIINEDWGTRLRDEVRDRLWLAETFDWLKALDPTRLVVDNSACDTAGWPNFHVRTDLADFHVYHGAPDNAHLWRHRVSEFADRPHWLWSPNGDARPTGDEPLILSEFGTWALPRQDRLMGDDGVAPWWFATGRGILRPEGIVQRFTSQRLDRIWPSLDALAEATQWHQAEALQYEIGEIRRHDSIQGYVITELADAYWEANGLLDVHRGRKAHHGRIRAFNAQDVVVADLPRRDWWSGERLTADVHLGSYGSTDGRDETAAARLEWTLEGTDGRLAAGSGQISVWPTAGASLVGQVDLHIPSSARGDARLSIRAIDGTGKQRAADEYRLAILPQAGRTTSRPRRVIADDPLGSWRVRERLSALGHDVHVSADDCVDADVVVATETTPAFLGRVEAGAAGLLLVRSRAAITDRRLGRPVVAHARALRDPARNDERSPWEGDWVTAWSWILPGALPGLPERNPLDFAYAEVIPDHVLGGYDPSTHADEVFAGMFAGWVHAPAALGWTFPHGSGSITATTFRVAPESGPVATMMLDGLLDRAARSIDPRGR